MDLPRKNCWSIALWAVNGITYRGGTQPPLEPFAVLAALRRLLQEPDVLDREVISIVGPPYSVAGCSERELRNH